MLYYLNMTPQKVIHITEWTRYVELNKSYLPATMQNNSATSILFVLYLPQGPQQLLMEKNKEFRNKVLKRLYGVREEKEEHNPGVQTFDELVFRQANQNEKIYGAEPPPEKYTETPQEIENNELSSDTSQDQSQSIQRRRRRKRKVNPPNEKTEDKVILPDGTLTKNQKRKLKKKRRKEKIKEEGEGNLASEFVYKPVTND